MKHAIYTLADPRDQAVRYIGRSNQPGKRLREHITEAAGYQHCAKDVWLQELAAAGLAPIQTIIEWCETALVVARERGWIYWYAMLGADLVNGNVPRELAGRRLRAWLDARKIRRLSFFREDIAQAALARFYAERADTPGAGLSAPEERTAEGTGGQDEEVLR